MKTKCPECKQKYELDKEYLGRQVTCLYCSNIFTVSNIALTECPDCFGSISRRAETCPHCGACLKNSGIDSTNDTEEEIKAVLHQSFKYYLPDIILGIVLIPVLLIGIPIIIFAIIRYKCTVCTITNHKIIVRSGWINKKENSVWIKDIRGINLTQSFFERLLGLGSIDVGTAATAGSEIKITAIKEAENVIALINAMR